MPPAARRSMPHTLKPHKRFSSGLSQSLVAFWMLCLGSAPALKESSGRHSVPPNRHPRRAGSCVPRAAHFSLGQAWGMGGTPKFPQSDTRSTPLEDGKPVARRFWSQSQAGCSCESKTTLPKGSTIRLSPQVLFMEGGVV